MSESTSNPKLNFLAIPVFFVMTTMTGSSLELDSSTLNVVSDKNVEDVTSSKPNILVGELKTWEQMKAHKIRELRGKYRGKLSSSDEFAERKRQEIAIEG